MPFPNEDYRAGTASTTAGSRVVTGVSTSWLAQGFSRGDYFFCHGYLGVIETVDSDTQLTLYDEFPETFTNSAYGLRLLGDADRFPGQLRELIRMLASGAFFKYDASGTLAQRAVYDTSPQGFAYLRTDVVPFEIYVKASNTAGDWAGPSSYVQGETGDTGPMPIVQAGTVATGLPGTNAIVTVDPISGGYEIDFTIPAGAGFYWQNAYNPANAYAKDFVVRSNGSSFIALQAVPAGTAPSAAFPPVDTAYWAVLASKGADGTIAGNTGASDNRLIRSDGTGGTTIQSTGIIATDANELQFTGFLGQATPLLAFQSNPTTQIAVMEGTFGSAGWLLGYGARGTNSLGGYVSSYSSALARSVFKIDHELEYLVSDGAAVAYGNPVTLTSVFKVNSAGLLTIGQGIKFPTIQSPSGDVNTLDDYEEGSWTPAVTASTGTINSYSAGGRYTKIGRAILFDVTISIIDAGSANNSVAICTLPFPVASGFYGTAAGRREAVGGQSLAGQMSSTGTSMFIFMYDNTGPITTSALLILAGHYTA